MRTGDEPTHARSALRLRLALTVFGLVCAVIGAVVVASLGGAVAATVFVVLGLVALVDLGVVVARIRQGPHYQPTPAVPPYHPADSTPTGERGVRAAATRSPVPMQRRKRRYLLLMGLCLTLVALAWGWIRFYSTTAAIVMTAVAMAIPPLAVVIANAGSPINRPRSR
jgi:hypothetical protein